MNSTIYSLASFGNHLITSSIATIASIDRGLHKVAGKIETTAKDKIGHYQGESGPFSEWSPLADSTEEEKERLGYPLDAPLEREGTLRESITHEVHLVEAVIGSKSPVMEYQEFGTQHIPPRPVIGPAAFENKEFIHETLGIALVEGIYQERHVAMGIVATTSEHIPSGLYDFKTP